MYGVIVTSSIKTLTLPYSYTTIQMFWILISDDSLTILIILESTFEWFESH